MNDGKRPEPRNFDSVIGPKFVVMAEVDRETNDWLSQRQLSLSRVKQGAIAACNERGHPLRPPPSQTYPNFALRDIE